MRGGFSDAEVLESAGCDFETGSTEAKDRLHMGETVKEGLMVNKSATPG